MPRKVNSSVAPSADSSGEVYKLPTIIEGRLLPKMCCNAIAEALGKSLRSLEAGRVFSGVAGKSIAVQVYLPNKRGGGQNLIVKFASPDRIREESDSIAHLKPFLEQWGDIIVLPTVHTEYGITVSKDLGAIAKLCTLKDYYEKELSKEDSVLSPDVIESCLRALRIVHTTTTFQMTQHTKDRKRKVKWKDILTCPPAPDKSASAKSKPDKSEKWKEVLTYAKTHCQLDPAPKTVSLGQLVSDQKDSSLLPNPLHNLYDMLNDDTGHIAVTTIHGDSNVTNFLVCDDHDGTERRLRIIDFGEKFHFHTPLADLARLESELFLEVLCRTEDTGTSFSLPEFVDVFKRLDTVTDVDLISTDKSKHAQIVRLIAPIRMLARNYCAIASPPPIHLRQYYQVLYFTYMNAVRFKTIRDDNKRTRMAIIGAALCLSELSADAHRQDVKMIVPVEKLRTRLSATDMSALAERLPSELDLSCIDRHSVVAIAFAAEYAKNCRMPIVTKTFVDGLEAIHTGAEHLKLCHTSSTMSDVVESAEALAGNIREFLQEHGLARDSLKEKEGDRMRDAIENVCKRVVNMSTHADKASRDMLSSVFNAAIDFPIGTTSIFSCKETMLVQLICLQQAFIDMLPKIIDDIKQHSIFAQEQQGKTLIAQVEKEGVPGGRHTAHLLWSALHSQPQHSDPVTPRKPYMWRADSRGCSISQESSN